MVTPSQPPGTPWRRRPRPSTPSQFTPQPPAAQSPYGVTAEMFLTSWTDISTYVYQRDTVTVQRGRQNEAATMQPGQATLTLNNRDGRFTTRNPVGAYYPSLVQNTPLRLSVPASSAGLSNYLRFEGDNTSSVTTPDKAALQITGPIDIRVDCWPSDYSGNVLAAKWGGTAKSWLFTIDALNWNHPVATPPYGSEKVATGTMGFYWFDGSNTQFLRCNQLLPYFGQRIALRVLFTPSTGTAQFYTAATMAGPFTQLGASQVFGATTLSNGAGQAVQVGGGPIIPWPVGQDAAQLTFGSALGMVYEAQVYSNVTLVADPVFSAQTPGGATFFDAQGNQWTLTGTAELSSRLYRFHGEMGSFPKAADPSATDVYSQSAAYGITKRLQNSNTPLQSPMRRAIVRAPAASQVQAYWPCEDGTGAAMIGAAVGGAAIRFTGTPTLASSSAFKCSAPLPVMNGAVFTGSVSPAVSPTGAQVSFLWLPPAGGEADGSLLARVLYTGSVLARVDVTYHTASGGSLTVQGFDSNGSSLGSAGPGGITGLNGSQWRVAIETSMQFIPDQDVVLEIISVGGTSSTIANFITSAAAATPSIGSVQIGAAGITGSVIGHVVAQSVITGVGDQFSALTAWQGELAAVRFARICAEEGIACRIVGAQQASMPMGNQPADTPMNLLQQCENTDLGMMFEPRQCLGIGYRTRTSLYHQSPLATVSYSSGQLFQGFASTGDTQLAVNDVTATSPSGSTARQQLLTGAMSVLSPPNGISRVDTQISPNPQADSQLNQIASWYLSVRSADDDRYPAIPFQMPRPSTPSAVALLDMGDYLQITGTPSWLPPGPVKQLCAGTSETFFPAALWLLEVNGIPELPYETAVAGAAAGTAGNAKADTAGSQLTASITSSATSFQVTTTAGPVWVQNGLYFPFDIVCEGEQMTVSGISSATSPQTFTISARSVNGVVKAHSAGAAVSLYRKAIAAL